MVAESLLQAMQEVLGEDNITPEVVQAWGEAYQQLAEMLQQRESELYKSST